jgi:hypothetical protein
MQSLRMADGFARPAHSFRFGPIPLNSRETPHGRTALYRRARSRFSFQFGSNPRLTAPAHPLALCALDAMHQLSGNSSHAA